MGQLVALIYTLTPHVSQRQTSTMSAAGWKKQSSQTRRRLSCFHKQHHHNTNTWTHRVGRFTAVCDVLQWVFWPENLKNTKTSRHSRTACHRNIYISGPVSTQRLFLSTSMFGESWADAVFCVIRHPGNQEMEGKLVLAASVYRAETECVGHTDCR